MSVPEPYSVDKLTAEARRLAADYRRATGKTLPLSGEIVVNDAIRLLDLESPTEVLAGCDAIRRTPNGLVGAEVKGRVVSTMVKSRRVSASLNSASSGKSSC